MERIKKEPHPAKSAARIDNVGIKSDFCKIQNDRFSSNSRAIEQDAKTLQYLKQDCHRTGRGGPTLQKVFTGLLSVHNRNLTEFADALKAEGCDGKH